MTYRLTLTDADGKIVSQRRFNFKFDRSEDWRAEEYQIGIKMREMYRDAAYDAGRWQIMRPELKMPVQP